MKARVIVIVGERDLESVAHQGIEASLTLFRRDFDPGITFSWIGTGSITDQSVAEILSAATGIWCAPGSPYESVLGALSAIRNARVGGKAFLGTCGGFQHALMEFARNVLGHDAQHEETTPLAREPLISKLSCSLVETRARVLATDEKRFKDILGAKQSTEEFHCNYGMNTSLVGIFSGSDLAFVAHDESGQIRAFRLDHHPFFIGTLFQPERRALHGSLHPIVHAFLQAA